ncbi:MAG: rhomboid family intramembrane serine protease [Polyangiales bacterium]
MSTSAGWTEAQMSSPRTSSIVPAHEIDPDAPHLRRIGPMRGGKLLHERALVLKSMGVAHGLSAQPQGFYFVVGAHDLDRSLSALREFEEELREEAVARPRRAKIDRLPYATSMVAPLAMLALVAFFWMTGPAVSNSIFFRAGVAESPRILHGELHRAVTALTLHADAGHVLSNAVGGTLFLGTTMRRLGPGRGLFVFALAGAFANAANALGHELLHHHHGSLGASTAVFAAVGTLGATQFLRNREAGVRRWTDYAGPIVGSLALLGMLGASPDTDLWAHGLGFVFGALFGALFGAFELRRERLGTIERAWVQPLYGLATVALIGGSWALALRGA